MLNHSPLWLLGGWLTTVALVLAWSVGVEARLSTSALLLVIGMAPGIVLLVIRAGAAAPTVAEILHSVTVKDGRS